jgi:hypothetical protein
MPVDKPLAVLVIDNWVARGANQPEWIAREHDGCGGSQQAATSQAWLLPSADGIPTLAHKPPSGPNWVHEIKHDGYRLIVRRDGKAVRLFMRRRGSSWTSNTDADGTAVFCTPACWASRALATQWIRSRRGRPAAM